MRTPIACSLTADDAQDRLAEWRELLSSSVDATELDGATARLRLAPGRDTAVRAVDLAAREVECCPFFEFSVDLRAGEQWLRVTVPQEARDVLGELLGLDPPAQ